jgi:valyl-tRNA synthetase
MILMAEFAVKTPPFKKVFLHGLIYAKSFWRQDANGHIQYVTKEERKSLEMADKIPKGIHFKWEKMSKSKGNVIDPVEMIETYGVDAVRFTLLSSVSHARQIDLDMRKFEEGRNFINKIWNSFRFVHPHLIGHEHKTAFDMHALFPADIWILQKLKEASQEVHSLMERYFINEATMRVYRFFWDEFCSVYLEAIKPVLFKKGGLDHYYEQTRCVLVYVLIESLSLMHPFIPFVTEEIFQHIKKSVDGLPNLLALRQVETMPWNADVEFFDTALDWVQKIRNVRAQMQIPLGAEIDILVQKTEGSQANALKAHQVIETLSKSRLQLTDQIDESQFGTKIAFNDAILFIPLPQDLLFKELVRTEKQITATESKIAELKTRLQNPEFVAKVPQNVLDNTKKQHDDLFHECIELKNHYHKLLHSNKQSSD